MNSHEKFEEMVYVYSIGALDGEDLVEFEYHLDTGCELCRKLLKENSEIVSVIPYSVNPQSPPPHLETRIMNSTTQDRLSYEVKYKSWLLQRINPVWLGLSTATVTVLLIISLFFNYQLNSRLEEKELQIISMNNEIENKINEIQSLTAQVNRNQSELSTVLGSYEKYGEVTDFLQDPDVVIINLVSTLPELKAVGRILLQTRDNEVMFISSNLPEAPRGKIYQMWLIADNTPKSVGIFNVGSKADNIVDLGKLSDTENIQKFAVTLEPEGGVPSPTGEMYLAGDV